MKTILVPTDFSNAANNALEYAVNLARFFNARLVLINACSMPLTGYDTPPALDLFGRFEEISLDAVTELRNKIASANPDLELLCDSKMGTTLGVIKEMKTKYMADLIVMGIVGQAGAIKEHLVGSTTLDVVEHMQTPLLIIPERVSYKPIVKISFAFDNRLAGDKVLVDKVREFCLAFGAKLETINIENPEEEIKPSGLTPTYEYVENSFKNLAHETIVLSDEDAALALENYLNNHSTNMVIVNPGKYSFLKSLFHKSITRKLAFHLHIPLLVVHS